MADETPDNRPPDGPLPDEPRLDGDARPEGGAAPDAGSPRLPGAARGGLSRGGAPRNERGAREGGRGARPARDRARARELPLGPRLFTVAEANALIPFLERALSELSALRGDLRSLRKEIEILGLIAASGHGAGNPDAAELRDKRRSFRAVAAEIEKINAALETSGCLVKHPDEGLVDFFHLRGDRLVFLCWQAGEERIRAWHPLSGGFATRQPLDHGTA